MRSDWKVLYKFNSLFESILSLGLGLILLVRYSLFGGGFLFLFLVRVNGLLEDDLDVHFLWEGESLLLVGVVHGLLFRFFSNY